MNDNKAQHLPRSAITASADMRGLIVAGFAVIIVFFGGFGTWAAVAPLSGAAIAPGAVGIEGRRKSIQDRDGGVVRELLVKEGDLVAEGQVLIRLDRTETRADLGVLGAKRDALMALEARLVAERDGLERPSFAADLLARRDDPAVAELITGQTALFEGRRRLLQGEIGLLRQRIVQLDEQIGGSEAELAAVRRQLGLIEEEAAGVRDLYRKGVTPKTRVLALERAAASLQGEAGRLVAETARSRQAIGETELRILQLQRDRGAEIANQLRDTRNTLAELAPRLEEARAILARTELRAPEAGRVVGLTAFTVGGVIAPGARVLDIVPTEGRLIVDARVSPENIEEVAAGMAARVRLTGIAQSRYPILDGVVETLSADRLTDPQTGEGYYTAQVRLEEDERLQDGRIRLLPGMPTETTIVTVPRTALDYLVSPLTDSFARAFREE